MIKIIGIHTNGHAYTGEFDTQEEAQRFIESCEKSISDGAPVQRDSLIIEEYNN